MNFKIIFLSGLVATLASCSTAYKAGQTPDDVYYSPAKELVEKRYDEKKDRYEDYASSEDDRYLRMKVRNRNRWNTIDDYEYWYDPRYNFGITYSVSNNSCGCYSNYYGWNNSPWRPVYYSGFGGWYSPTCTVVFYKSPKVFTGNTSKSNLAAYRNKTYNNQNYSVNPKTGASNGSGFGNLMKTVFSTSGDNSGSSWGRATRSFEPGSSTSSSAGGKSGGFGSSGSSSSSGRAPRNN